MDDFHKVQDIAIGGYKCPCCGPSPKNRKRNRRNARQRLKAVTRLEIQQATATATLDNLLT